MKTLWRSLVVAGALAFVTLGLQDLLPPGLQMHLWNIMIVGSAMGGGNVHVGSFSFLVATLVVVFAAVAYPILRWRDRSRAGRLAAPGASAAVVRSIACLVLFTAAFRLGESRWDQDPWSSPLRPMAVAYAIAGLLAGCLWRSPRVVLSGLLLSAPLAGGVGWLLPGLRLSGLDELIRRGADGMGIGTLVRLRGLTALAGVLAGGSCWGLARLIAGVAASRTRPLREIGPVPRIASRLRPATVAAFAAVALGLSLAGREAVRAWWPPSAPPWAGADRFHDASLAPLLEPDRRHGTASFYETQAGEALYTTGLSEKPPRSYEDDYIALLRSRGVLIRAEGGSAYRPRPVDSYEFLILRAGVDREDAFSVRYRRFWDTKREETADSFWWPITFYRPYPGPVQIEGRMLSVRLGRVRSAEWSETWPLPERDETQAPEFPLPRFPGAVVRDWGPERDDRAFLQPHPPFDVDRSYVVRGASPQQVVAHYDHALRALGLAAAPDRGVAHGLEWSGKEPFRGLIRIAVSANGPGLVWGSPLNQGGREVTAERLFPRLRELTQFRVSVRFDGLEGALAHWPDADRQRRELLLAERNGGLQGRISPSPLAPAIAVLGCGWAAGAVETLTGALRERVRLVSPTRVNVGLLAQHRVLFVPTGGLAGLGAQTDFVEGLRAFVRSGGVVIALSQAQGRDYRALPVPEGQRLRALGSSADQSAYGRGVRVDQSHPALASLAESVVSMNVDGCFEEVPDSALVLLRKARNDLPALIAYRVGHGWVVASSSFDDCVPCARPGPGQPAVLGDLLAWAREPGDLAWSAPGSVATLTIPAANRSQSASTSVRLRLVSPTRDRFIAEATLPLSLDPGRQRNVTWPVRIPDDARNGIHHVSYTLLGADGRVAQPAVESDAARVVVGRPLTGSAPVADLGVTVVLPAGDRIDEGQPMAVEYSLSNHLGQERRLRLYWNTSRTRPESLGELVLAPRGSARGVVVVRPKRGEMGFWLQVFELGATPKHGPRTPIPGETAAFQLAEGKGFRVSERR